jgi:hypothetical protein
LQNFGWGVDLGNFSVTITFASLKIKAIRRPGRVAQMQLCTGRWCRWMRRGNAALGRARWLEQSIPGTTSRLIERQFFDNPVDCIRQPRRDEISIDSSRQLTLEGSRRASGQSCKRPVWVVPRPQSGGMARKDRHTFRVGRVDILMVFGRAGL